MNKKLTPEQKEQIRTSDASTNMLAEQYKVSRRLIQFIRHPERLAKVRQHAKDRQISSNNDK